MIPVSKSEKAKQVEQAHENSRREYKIRDFLAMHFDKYCETHKVPEDKLKIIRTMILCKTGANGYTLTYCPTCNRYDMHAASCGNRNCPSCGWLDTQKWIEERKAELLDGISYYHVVFTLPHQLTDLISANEKLLLGTLFAASKDAILELSDKEHGMVPGLLMVLHSFGSNLSRHYHIHMLASGGGLAKDKSRFITCENDTFFLPVDKVKAVYREKFMTSLKSFHEDGQLKYEAMAEKYRNRYEWSELMSACYAKNWNVEIKTYGQAPGEKTGSEEGSEPCEELESEEKSEPDEELEPDEETESEERRETEKAIEYFARYTNRAAITDSRIRSYDADSITFEYKDYRDQKKQKKVMTLTADEFITRFLAHILPKGFRKVRTAGFLSGCVRKKNMILIHKLRGTKQPECKVKGMNKLELIKHFWGKDPTKCDKCHTELVIYQRVDKKDLPYCMHGG